jgi:hypothetical protein
VIRRRRSRRGLSGNPIALALVVLASTAVAACVSGGPASLPPSTIAVSTAEATPGPASPSPQPSVSGSPTPAPTALPTPIPGTGRVVVAADAFAITLPSGWRRVPLDGSSIADIVAQLPATVAAALKAEVADAKANGYAFLAIDLRAATLASGNASTVNVNVQAASDLPLALLEPLVTGFLDSAPGVTGVVATDVSLPAGPAIRITYTLALSTTAGTMKLAGTQFVLLSSKHTYTVSFGCRYASASSCRSQADAMMKTFDLL